MKSFTDLKWLNTSGYREIQLSPAEIEFLSIMVRHNRLALAIRRINQIGNEHLDDETYHNHIKEILESLSNKNIIYVDHINAAGITTFRGNFVLHKNLIPKQNETPLDRFRRLLVITHEAFGHCKRLRYSHHHNVLLDTPEDDQIMMSFDGVKPEAGNYIELSVFGTLVTQ